MPAFNMKVSDSSSEGFIDVYKRFISEFTSRGGELDDTACERIKTKMSALKKSGRMIEEMSFDEMCQALYDIREIRTYLETAEDEEGFAPTAAYASTLAPAEKEGGKRDIIEGTENNETESSGEASSPAPARTKKGRPSGSVKKNDGAPMISAKSTSGPGRIKIQQAAADYSKKKDELLKRLNFLDWHNFIPVETYLRLKALRSARVRLDSSSDGCNSYAELLDLLIDNLYSRAFAEKRTEILSAFEIAEAEIRLHELKVKRELDQLRADAQISDSEE